MDNEINNENYREIIENHWKWKCNLCHKNDSFNRRFKYYRIICNENDTFTNQKLQHLVCFQCYHNKVINNKTKKCFYPKEINKIIYCYYCETYHYIYCIKDVSEDNEIENSCHLF